MNHSFLSSPVQYKNYCLRICFAGDEVLGATINFDKLSKEEVLKVLKLMEPFDDKVQVLTRSNLSRSLENLDVRAAKNPETVG